jgi:hypothetical protein
VTLVDPDACTRASLSRISKAFDLEAGGFEMMECVNEANTKLPLR